MGLELKAVYSINEIARVAGTEPRTIRGLMTAHGVTVYNIGPRCSAVLLGDLKTKMPVFWESLLDLDGNSP